MTNIWRDTCTRTVLYAAYYPGTSTVPSGSTVLVLLDLDLASTVYMCVHTPFTKTSS